MKEFKDEDYEEALKKSFLELDSKMKTEFDSTQGGSTACVVLVTPLSIYCANAGDSRAVLKSGEE